MWVCCVVFLHAEMREFEWFMVRHGNRRILWFARFFLRDRNMIRRACGDSYVEHDVYIDEQKGAREIKGARGIKGAGNAAGCSGDAAGCPGDAGVLWQNVMYRGGLRCKTFDFCAYIVHTAGFLLRVCWQVGSGRVYKAV